MTQTITATSEAERLRRLAMNAECIPCEDEGFADWQKRRRIVAIGSSFVVTTPGAPVSLRPVQPPADWPTEDEIDIVIGKNYGYA